MRRARVLIVEDERVVARDVAHQLQRLGHEVVGITGLAEEAAELAEQSGAELVLMDIRLDGARDGVEAAREIRERLGLPVIFLTAYADDETLERAAETAPHGYLIKPFEDAELRTTITLALVKHETELRLRESERLYAVTLASLADGVIATDAHAEVTFMNPVAERLTGVDAQAARGRPLREVFRVLDEDSRELLEEPASRVLHGKAEYLLTGALLQGIDGREAPIEASIAPILDRGITTGAVLVFRDVSQARLAREASSYRIAHARMELALRGSKTAVYDFEMPNHDLASATLHEINCWESLGYDTVPERLSLATRSALWHPDDQLHVQRAIAAYLAGETPDYEVECRVRHRDGSYRWRMSRGLAIRDEQGRVVRFVGSSSDITERKQLELELRAAKEVAETANRTKDEFLANVSHEMRTPLTAVLGMTELVLDTELSEEQRSGLVTVRSAASNLLSMINDLLDFAKIEAGKLKLEVAPIALRELLEEIWRSLALRAERKDLQLVFDVQEDVPARIVGDAGRLRQVLVNLVDNAIKFTDRGRVELAVRRTNDPGEPHVELTFSVEDTGIGIAAESLQRIFDAFEQEDVSLTRRYGGTGLGLTIAARAAALMGGTLRVDSEPQRGSRFELRVRFELASCPDAAARASRVLVLEHNAVSRGVLLEWLGSWGLEVVAVEHARDALEGRWHALNQRFDAVLVNPRMPGLDLSSLAQQLRGRAELAGARLIALGALPADALIEVSAQLAMPVLAEELRAALRGHDLGRTPSDPRADEVRPLRVLIAEDNPLNGQFLRQLLCRRGHQPELAEDGVQALDLLERQDFDLLLLDLHMPHRSGFDVIEAIRARERGTNVRLPVIALTARSRREDRARCLEAGMDDFLTKPLVAADLWSAIERVRARRSRPALGPHASSLDAALLLATCDAEPEVLATLCGSLHAHLPRHVDRTLASFHAQDAASLREHAHQLFNLVAGFSHRAGALASELEDHSARGNLAAAAALIADLPELAAALLRDTARLTVRDLEAAR